MLKGNVITREQLPLWYEVYKAFPPKAEPTLKRRVDQRPVRNLVYTEDMVRGHFYNTYPQISNSHVNLTKDWDEQRDKLIVDK